MKRADEEIVTGGADAIIARVSTLTAMKRELAGIEEKHRVNFALSILLDITDPNHAGLIAFTATQAKQHADRLMALAFEEGCI